MRCFIDNQEVAFTCLAPVAMNFGQLWRDARSPLTYRIETDFDEFVQRIEGDYARTAKEEQDDLPNQAADKGFFPTLERWAELRYPPLRDLLTQEPILAAELFQRNWYAQELLDHLLDTSASRLPQYLINTIDKVVVADGRVKVEGIAYPHPALAARNSDVSAAAKPST